MPLHSDRILVYDGECSFCEGASRWLVAQRLLREEARRPFQAFRGATAARLLDAGIGNELLLYDPSTGGVERGVSVLEWLLADAGHTRWAAGLAWPPVRAVSDLLYRTIARNRRLLFPPPRRHAACACDPDPAPRDRVTLVVLFPVVLVIVLYLTGHRARQRALEWAPPLRAGGQ